MVYCKDPYEEWTFTYWQGNVLVGDIQTGECQTISYHLMKPTEGIWSYNNTLSWVQALHY